MRLRGTSRLVIATVAILLVSAFSSAASAQAASCITTLPVTVSFPKSTFSIVYKDTRTLPVRITTQGPRITRAKVELYTFNGDLLARGKISGAIRSTRTVKMRTRFVGMQNGKYTLVVTGEPNRSRSCGPKKHMQVVSFRDCFQSLPISFPNKPGGYAQDYGRWLSVHMAAKAGFVRNVLMTVSSFSGNIVGRGRLSVLFGRVTINMRLSEALKPGGYTVTVTGDGGQPKACGAKNAQAVLTFLDRNAPPANNNSGANTGDPDEGGQDPGSPPSGPSVDPDEGGL